MESNDTIIWPINIGTSYEFSIKQLAEIILQLIPDSQRKIIYQELPKDDPKQRRADSTKAKELLGREPQIELKQWLKKTIAYFNQLKS